jgi:hypothetical protein
MNSPEREVHTLDALDNLDIIMCGGLQSLAELLSQNDPNARVCEPASNRTYPRRLFGLRGLFLRLLPQT